MNKKFVIISITIALLLIGIITVSSYAYFTIGNKQGDENVITSGSMTLELSDGAQITLNNMVPGQYIEKEFSVTNTGNVNSSYDIYLSEVINNFADKTDLVYEIISNDGGYNTTNQVQVPSVSSKIIDNYSIDVNDTHHYKLKITFLNKNEDQNDNQGKIFSAIIQVNEYQNIRDYTITYNLNKGTLGENITNPTIYNMNSSSITLNNPTRIGYMFAGWTGSNGQTPQKNVTIPAGSYGDKEYVANWTEKNIYNLYGYTNSSIIPYETFTEILDNDIFDSSIIGARITDSNNHNWRIIEVGDDYYDLWYDQTIGKYQWHTTTAHNASQNTGKWSHSSLRANLNGDAFYNNTSLLPTDLKSYIITKEVHASVYWCSDYSYSISDDYVWILTQTELSITSYYSDTLVYTEYDGTKYRYFSRSINDSFSYKFWDASSCIVDYGVNWYAGHSRQHAWGDKVTTYNDVIPAIRVS